MMPSRLAVLFIIGAGTAAQTRTFRAQFVRSPARVQALARDGLQQMGYTIQKTDSAAGILVADRVARMNLGVGRGLDQLELKIAPGQGDTTVVEITVSSWTKFDREVARHRDRTASRQAEVDAQRLLDALK